jgi:hypothetical protein
MCMGLQSLTVMNSIKVEIAARAAQMIADSGLDYGSAKRKAALELCGAASLPKDSLPANEDIDHALLEHLELFDPGHAQRVQSMREAALDLMDKLAEFQIYISGAAWKGICAEHAYVHLQSFHDNPKELEYALLNLKLAYEAEMAPHWRGDGDTEALAMLYPFQGERVPILLALYSGDEVRGALKAKIRRRDEELPARGDRAALRRILRADALPHDRA